MGLKRLANLNNNNNNNPTVEVCLGCHGGCNDLNCKTRQQKIELIESDVKSVIEDCNYNQVSAYPILIVDS